MKTRDQAKKSEKQRAKQQQITKITETKQNKTN